MTSDRRDRLDHEVDKASADSFPASDPPAFSGITGAGRLPRGPKRKDEDRPTGSPTSDRHATETAHQQENEVSPGRKQGR